jgi:hypothetical protein
MMRDRCTIRRIHRPKGYASFQNDPYSQAEMLFTAGRIPVAQAVGMMLSDRDFVAECEMGGRDKRLHAETIVRDIWARRLLETSNG